MFLRKIMLKTRRHRKYLFVIFITISFFLMMYMELFGAFKSKQKTSIYLPLVEEQKRGNDYSELYDPLSPSYGILRKNLYGYPLENFGIKPYHDDKLFFSGINWKLFFAPLFDAIFIHEKLHKNEPKTAQFGSASLTIEKNNYAVGSEFEATLQSYDKAGNKKFLGGDFFRVRLVDNIYSPFANGVPCRVSDNEDGTYTIKAPLHELGTFWLDVKLVLPLEGMYELLQATQHLKSWSFDYEGTLENGEYVHCSVSVPSKSQLKNHTLCDFTNPTNMEPLFCTKPSSGQCSRVVNLRSKSESTESSIHEKLQQLCRTHGCLSKVKTDISVSVVSGKEPWQSSVKKSCRENFSNESDIYIFSGYVSKNRWVSLECKSDLELGSITINNCLRNKVIYFLGDQTIHQFFEYVASELNLIEKSDDGNIWHKPKVAHQRPSESGQNLTIYYRAHGLPFLSSGPTHTFPYISDIIENLQVGGKDVYVIMALGYDFLNYDPSTYVNRLVKVRKSIEKHHKKFPETKFIIKGMHVVEQPYEWLLLRLELISRVAFVDLNNVVYANMWDFSNIWSPKTVQPEKKILQDQQKIIFGYVC